jgi:hypothetical protein
MTDADEPGIGFAFLLPQAPGAPIRALGCPRSAHGRAFALASKPMKVFIGLLE